MSPVPLIQCFPCGSVRGVQHNTVQPSSKPHSLSHQFGGSPHHHKNPISPSSVTSPTLLGTSQVLYTEEMLQELCYEIPESLQIIIDDPKNQTCADCDSNNCEWASLGFGTIICLNCAGYHRSLGAHLTSVRSIRLDGWSDRQVSALKLGGNARFKKHCAAVFTQTFPATTALGNSVSVGIDNTSADIQLQQIVPSLSAAAAIAVTAVDAVDSTVTPSARGLTVYGNPQVLYFSEILKAELDERTVQEYDESRWLKLASYAPNPSSRSTPSTPTFGLDSSGGMMNRSGSSKFVIDSSALADTSSSSCQQQSVTTDGTTEDIIRTHQQQQQQHQQEPQSPSAWMSDKSSKNCTICAQEFTLMRRRHHCRRCGNLCCSDCAPKDNSRPILEWGLKDPVRHCKHCYRSPVVEWK